MNPEGTPKSALGVAAMLIALAALAAACVMPTSSPPEPSPPEPSSEDASVPWLTATRGEHPAIFDQSGREVVLRGMNLNHLGDYFSSDPALPSTATLDDADWSAIAAQGANVVRLVTSWSMWEPTRDTLDAAYLARVRATVADAARYGIHVVIDMHQDAWSKVVFTPRNETCPYGTHPQIGWDGAPAWATFTDDRPSCTPASREDSPAVVRAWDSFYRDRDGIRTALASLWGRIAAAFASDAAVAGFDLLNEPGTGSSPDGTVAGLTAFYRDAIASIRAAEAQSPDALPRGHMIFFETTVSGAWPGFDLSDDTNLVFAPHNYAESIGPSVPGLMDTLFGALRLLGSIYRTPVWIGEYGFFGDAPDELKERFAHLDDQGLGNGSSGGTWWQWEQECGDPHDVAGAWPASKEWVSAQLANCGAPHWNLRCSDRPYPRAVPGRLTTVTAACRGSLDVVGYSSVPGEAELWFPGASAAPPSVSGAGLIDASTTSVDGGWIVRATVSGDYRLMVSGEST